MKVYKIKHLPTGLYLKAAGREHNSLSKRGKLYQIKPDIVQKLLRDKVSNEYFIEVNHNTPGAVARQHFYNSVIYVKLSDFKLIEMEIQE